MAYDYGSLLIFVWQWVKTKDMFEGDYPLTVVFSRGSLAVHYGTRA